MCFLWNIAGTCSFYLSICGQICLRCFFFVYVCSGDAFLTLRRVLHVYAFLFLCVCLSMCSYGAREGTPSMRGLQLDALAALNHVTKIEGNASSRCFILAPLMLCLCVCAGVDPSRLVVFGRSLGGAVALHLAHAAQDKVRCVCLSVCLSLYECMCDVAARGHRGEHVHECPGHGGRGDAGPASVQDPSSKARGAPSTSCTNCGAAAVYLG